MEHFQFRKLHSSCYYRDAMLLYNYEHSRIAKRRTVPTKIILQRRGFEKRRSFSYLQQTKHEISLFR